MAKKRRSIGASLKSQVALAAARGDKTTAELSSHFGNHSLSTAMAESICPWESRRLPLR